LKRCSKLPSSEVPYLIVSRIRITGRPSSIQIDSVVDSGF
jgi:hypothetical protein